MIKVIIAAMITAGISFLVSSCNDQIENTRKHDIYYNTATVIEIGQCKESKCSFKYKTSDGETKFGLADTPMTIGQLVYQQCWTEKVKGVQCYVDYTPSKS
ncbi:hypothetical protein ENKO_144 [Klebsiella phage fENko-Kae01]|nr:hypothetical protein [Klebsiella phage fENko-Kae01]